MGRYVRRVELEFDWPLGEPWPWAVRQEAPPEGEGWQLWENVSEGSPVSPVFATAAELARRLTAPGADPFAPQGFSWTYEAALAFVHDNASP